MRPRDLPTHPLLLVQGEAPGKNEVEQGVPFVGKSGQWIRTFIIGQAGVEANQVIFDNTIRCLVGGKSGAYPTGKDKSTAESVCRTYDIWNDYPDVPLFLTGAKAIAKYLPDGKVSRWHGHVEKSGDRVIGATYHPSAVMRNPNLLPLVTQELRNLIIASKQPWRLERPKVKKGYLPFYDRDMVFDLEWNPSDETIFIQGVAYDGREGFSLFDSDADDLVSHIRSMAQGVLAGHNILTADLPVLGFTPEWMRDNAQRLFDTLTVSHIIHPHWASDINTDEDNPKQIGLGLYDLGSMVRYYEPCSEWKTTTPDQLLYNGYDCVYNFRLFEHLRRDLVTTDQEHLVKPDQELTALTVAMRQKGIALDIPELEVYANERNSKKAEAKAEFEFNPNSPKQIKEYFEKKGLYLKDTSFETLKKSAGKDTVLDELILFREDNKNLSTWFPLEEDKNGDIYATSSMIYPRFNVPGTSVARLSSSGPNFQNITNAGERVLAGGMVKQMPNLRRFIIPRDRSLTLVSFDYSQIEDWTTAWMSGDEVLLQDLLDGLDLHAMTASRYFKRPITKKDKAERYRGKQTNHASKYGETIYALCMRMFGRRTKAGMLEAELLQNAYFERYKGVKAWQNSMATRLDGGRNAIRNPYGRRRMVYASDPHERTKRGCHFEGCSTAAEVINRAAVNVWKIYDLVPILIVHDELVYELPKGDELDKRIRQIREILESPLPELGGLALRTECKVGPNYGGLSEYRF